MKRNLMIILLIVLIFILILIAGLACTKKVSTADKDVSVPEEGVTSQEDTSGFAAEDMEEHLSALESRLSEEEVSIKEDKPEVPRSFAGIEDIFFDFDRDFIRPSARVTLDKNGQWLKEHPNKRVVIEGHADERGTNEYNLALGERRVRAVKRYLVALGINPGRISTISYGEERPFCIERREECWQQNRRAHFVLTD